MNRLDCFNLAAARVMQRLLEVFPQPVVLDADAIQQELDDAHADCALRGGPGNPGSLVGWTIMFLVEEGYVRTSANAESHTRVFTRCVLTAKGFAALNRKLESLQPATSVGSQLLELGRAMAPEAASVIIGNLLG